MIIKALFRPAPLAARLRPATLRPRCLPRPTATAYLSSKEERHEPLASLVDSHDA
jgi:hypothetical protein